MIGVVVYFVCIYLVIGLAVSIPFVFVWCKRIDPIAGSATLGFKLLSIPGSAMLWPYILVRVKRA